MKTQSRKDIRNFLLVIAAGVLSSFVVVFWMIKDDRGAKDFKITDALISPSTIEQMSNRAVQPGSQNSAQYMIESIDFSYFDKDRGKWEMVSLDIAPYEEIYNLIHRDVGALSPGDAGQFFQGNGATLAIYVNVHKPYQEGAKNTLFQQIQFSNSDWYRVQLHADTTKPEWVYYQHKNILDEVLKIVKKAPHHAR